MQLLLSVSPQDQYPTPHGYFLSYMVCTGVAVTIAGTWKQPKGPWTEEWIRECGAYALRNALQL